MGFGRVVRLLAGEIGLWSRADESVFVGFRNIERFAVLHASFVPVSERRLHIIGLSFVDTPV